MMNILRKILGLCPMGVTPELACLRDSLLIQELTESTAKLRILLEGVDAAE